MINPGIAIQILLDGQHPALWESFSKRETMRFLRKRGKDIARNDLSRLIKAILAGPPRKIYQEMNAKKWTGLRDHTIRERLFMLTESGLKLPKLAQKKLDRIQREHPWSPGEGRSGEFPIFIRISQTNKDEIGKMENFSSMDVDAFIEWSATQEDKLWDCSGGWFLFCENEADGALKLLQKSGERDVWPIAPWYDALSRFRKNDKKISKRHKMDTAKALVEMPVEHLCKLDLQAARWLEHARKGLRKKLRRQLWENIWKASLLAEWEGNFNYDMTLNHAGGILASVLMDELAEYYPTATAGANPGFFKSLLPYFKLIGDGDKPSAVLARIRLSANLLYLFRIDREWTEYALLRRMDSENSDIFEAGLWEGYLWSPRIHDDLLEPLKPLFFRILENLDLISERVREHAPQLFIDISVPPDRGVTTKEAQEVLQDMPTKHLAEAARRLMHMLSGAGDKAPVLWRKTIEPWFKEAWPKHRKAKSSETSSNLAWMAIETGDAFPDAVNTIKDQLLPSRWGNRLHNLKEAELHKRSPEAAWIFIKHTIGDETQIAGLDLPELLDVIVQKCPNITNDADFQRLRARG